MSQVVRAFRNRGPVTPGLKCEDPSLAVQESKDECDINVIVRQFLRTGELPGLRAGVYADISEMVGLQDALHLVAEAQQSFMSLPADVRRRFDNDPVKLVEFANDKGNYDEAVKLGLIVKPEPSVNPGTPGSPVPAPGVPAPSPGGPKPV